MTAAFTIVGLFWLQEVPPRALLMGMTMAYLLCLAGLLFAYVSYRRRHKGGNAGDRKKKKMQKHRRPV